MVLAGERPGGNALARALGLPSALLADIADKAVIRWTFDALFSAKHARIMVVGPDASLRQKHPEFAELTADPRVQWQAPQAGPAASAEYGIERMGRFPLLLTAADHALLQGQWVDEFVARSLEIAESKAADIVLGLVPYSCVREKFPASKRTLLRFAEGAYCGSNQFLVATPQGVQGIRFWRSLEQLRKSPWRMARAIGWKLCLRYLLRRLSLVDAMQALSTAGNCRVQVCELDEPRLAIDVDSVADYELAQQILSAAPDS